LTATEVGETESKYAVAAFRILLLTGCRLSEIQTLAWNNVDLKGKELRLPDSKTGAKTVHLGETAVALLEAVPRVTGNPYVIVGKKEKTHLTDLQHPWRRIREAAGLSNVRIHDLRHTFASGGLLVGEGLAMIGQLLGHTQVQTTARYAHLAADPVKQAATKISDRLALALLGAIDKPSAEKAKQSSTAIDKEADRAAAA
jgi:integrase